MRQRDDRYVHEIHDPPPYNGIPRLQDDGRRLRWCQSLHVLDATASIRLGRTSSSAAWGLKVIGDCGGFSYVAEDVPPVTVDEVIDFYEDVGVDEGVVPSTT